MCMENRIEQSILDNQQPIWHRDRCRNMNRHHDHMELLPKNLRLSFLKLLMTKRMKCRNYFERILRTLRSVGSADEIATEKLTVTFP